jgi:cysteinyl-tRNA synthetase
MKLYNTLTRQLEEVKANENGIVTLYNCGPTVYWHQHIGNYRAYSNWDILHRALMYLGHKVKRIMNITDVGHLTSDDDFGEDKMEKGAKKLGTTDPYKVAEYFINSFITDMRTLNILSPSGKRIPDNLEHSKLKDYGFIRATESIAPMIKLIESMEEKGYVYQTNQAVYFDVTKYDEYTKLSGQKLEEKLVGVREDVNVDIKKKNPADFVLWMKRFGEYENHTMHWPSPWGDGFPGWHIECSAMGIENLGETISVHTGGIEHISVHHTNERAQNFGALEKEVVELWVHNEHLQSKGGEKLAKSAGNAHTIPELVKMGYDPMDIRWLLISANYRIPLQFSKESLDGARNSRLALISRLKGRLGTEGSKSGVILQKYVDRVKNSLDDNLNMSQAFSILVELSRSDESSEDVIATVLDFDRVFGLEIESSLKPSDMQEEIPQEVKELLEKRKISREVKDFAMSDSLRDEILSLGYVVKDTTTGQILEKKK